MKPLTGDPLNEREQQIRRARCCFASERWPGVDLAEGLVLRPAVELFDRGGRRVITKIKNKDFR